MRVCCFLMMVSWVRHEGFAGFVMRVFVEFVMKDLVVLSWGFCWLCHEGFVGFVMRVLSVLSCLCWVCQEGFVGFVIRV